MLCVAPAVEIPSDAKGIAEVTSTPTPAAIANVVAHAIGTQILQLPITAETVLAGLQAGKRFGQNR